MQSGAHAEWTDPPTTFDWSTDVHELRRELFFLRLGRWWRDLCVPLVELYGTDAAEVLAGRLVTLGASAFSTREPELARLDIARGLEPDWFQNPEMVGYAAYAERFADDLKSVADHIPYLRELGITYLHLMPILQARPGDSDGGYAVSDYRSIRAELGTFDDLRALTKSLRAAGISLVLDLVLNHVAREHPWAVAARAGSRPYRDYFHVFDDRVQPDTFELTLPEVFPHFAPGNFTWDDEIDGWVWTTFNSWQWDLNWTNPEVFFEFAEIVLYLANAGVDVLRLDAIAFLWKRIGTTSQNQPEVHAIVEALHALTRIVCPSVVFKAEAIVGPADLAPYLGVGARYGKVSDLAYHNSLMVQTWSMLATGDTALAVQALRSMPAIPSTTAWITYVRCHDDIGWAVADLDASTVGLDGPSHRSFLADYYTGKFPGSTALGLTFQHNPDTGDRRVSGTAASLAGLEAAVSSNDEDAVDVAIDRILLAYTIAYGWGGVPVIWSGDELGVFNDAQWADEVGHEDDNRWVHRRTLSAATKATRDDPSTVGGRIFQRVASLAHSRARTPQLHAAVASEILEPVNSAVLAVLRRHSIGNHLQLYNVSSSWQAWPVALIAAHGLAGAEEVLGHRSLDGDGDGQLWLGPYSAWWIG